MNTILKSFEGVPQLKTAPDDDYSDRLNHYHTPLMFIVFALIVQAKNYVGDPISCWVPAHFAKDHLQYTNDYCWVRNTYFLPYDEEVPEEHEVAKRDVLPYYQWVSLMMLFEALMFCIPCIIWRTFNARSGIDIANIITSGKKFTKLDGAEDREKVTDKMAKQMNRFLLSQKEYRGGKTLGIQQIFSVFCCRLCGTQKGNYLTGLYFITKLLYITNIIGQFFALGYFLGDSFFQYGVLILNDIARGDDWTETSRFPRVTMCDFKIRRLGNVHRYAVQCVLPVNLFNEKIFLAIWFWLLLLLIFCTGRLLFYTVRNIMCQQSNITFVKKHLTLGSKIDDSADADVLHHFVETYLRKDGVFIMRLVDHNTNMLTTSDFICAVWVDYIKHDGYTSAIRNTDD